MEQLSVLLARGFPLNRTSNDVLFDVDLNKRFIDNRVAAVVRRHDTHCDDTVMKPSRTPY